MKSLFISCWLLTPLLGVTSSAVCESSGARVATLLVIVTPVVGVQLTAYASGFVQRFVPAVWPETVDVIVLALARVLVFATWVYHVYPDPTEPTVAVAPDVLPVNVFVATHAVPVNVPTTKKLISGLNSNTVAYPPTLDLTTSPTWNAVALTLEIVIWYAVVLVLIFVVCISWIVSSNILLTKSS